MFFALYFSTDKPSINTTKLPKRIPVFRGYPEELVCEAEGHPPPEIEWLYSADKVPHESGDTLIVYEAGRYTCNATNEVDSTSHEVEVILKGKLVVKQISCKGLKQVHIKRYIN